MRKALLVLVVLAIAACTDAEKASLRAYNEPGRLAGRLALYSGGREVAVWCSSGIIHSTDSGSGFYFNDKASDRLVKVSGDVVITYPRACTPETPAPQAP